MHFSFKALKKLFNLLYETYEKSADTKDPVRIVSRFNDKRDLEIAGLFSSCFAYGNITSVNNFLELLFKRMNNQPFEFTINFTKQKDKKYLDKLYYRFHKSADLIFLLRRIKEILLTFGSLEKAFMCCYKNNSENNVNVLKSFCNLFLKRKKTSDENYFNLIPDPSKGSACKKMNLYLRWMIRKDSVDFGIWKNADKSGLIIPVDINVFNASTALGIMNRRTANLNFAIELTEKLKEFDKTDPVKFDYAMCHDWIQGDAGLIKKFINSKGRI